MDARLVIYRVYASDGFGMGLRCIVVVVMVELHPKFECCTCNYVKKNPERDGKYGQT